MFWAKYSPKALQAEAGPLEFARVQDVCTNSHQLCDEPRREALLLAARTEASGEPLINRAVICR